MSYKVTDVQFEVSQSKLFPENFHCIFALGLDHTDRQDAGGTLFWKLLPLQEPLCLASFVQPWGSSVPRDLYIPLA